MKISTFLYTLYLLMAVSLLPAQLRAQSFQLPTSGTTSYTTCSGTLYDDGGPNDAYALDTKGSVTLFPGAAGSKLRLEFTALELDSLYTNLTIYDGPDTSYPKIGNFYHGLPTVYATGGLGALTVVLTASGGLPQRGFAATIGCVTSIPSPDLAVQDLQLMRSSALAGESVWSTARITNLSGTQAATTLRYFLSTDTKPSPDDKSVYATDIAVTTGSWIPAERYVTIPDGTAPGTYYLLCVAQLTWDPSTEINSANNVTYAPLTVVRPTPNVDLVARYGYYSSNYQQVAVTTLFTSVEVQNRGQAPSVTSQLGYYLSADAVFSPDDTFLDYSPVKAIAAGTYTMVYGSASIPATATPGTYYLLCVVDYLDDVIEDEEQNNTLALRLVIPPLTIDVGFGDNYTVATTQPAPGGKVTVTCTLRNKGSIMLDSATVGFYLSSDRLLSADDVLLDHASSGTLWPDNSYYGFISRMLTIPAAMPLGKYYLLLAADYRNELAERNEQDNVLPLSLDVVVPAIDVTIKTLMYNGIYAPVAGDVVANRLAISNQGTTQAYPVVVGYYLSTDDQLSPNDLPIGQVTLEPLAGGESRVVDVANRYNGALLPANTVAGTYYLLAVADHLQQAAETNETNNVMAIPIQVKRPDIDLHLPHNFSVLPASTTAGTSVKVDYNLGNLGTTSAYAPSLGFYLSTDAQFGPDDILIGSDELYSDIYPAYYTHTTRNVAIPRNVPSGRYYLLGVADYLNEFAETDETNNVRYAALEITAARPDLIIQARPYLSPRQVVAGSVVTTESYINNIGAGPASASSVGYYLSTDPVFSPNDVLLGSTAASAVQTGYSTIVTGTFTVPAGTVSGRYYVLFIADYQNTTADDDRTNNSAYTTISITGRPLATREQTAGYELRVGPVPARQGTPICMQFSGPGTRTEVSLGLYNNLGQLLTTRGIRLTPGQNNQVEIPTMGLAAGVYMLRLTGPSLNAVRRVVLE
jgi:subtilase family serine protease